jgi:argininosuccinate lyase
MSGRLSRPPHPVLFELLYEPQLAHAQQDVLPHLLAIDAAHVVMLAERGLLAPATASALLRVNRELTDRLECGADVLETPRTHRGLYFVYEREYITRLGETIGGAAHLARSRNDINATVARMRLRETLAGTLDRSGGLVEAMAAVAAAHAETAMSGFTHLSASSCCARSSCWIARTTPSTGRRWERRPATAPRSRSTAAGWPTCSGSRTPSTTRSTPSRRATTPSRCCTRWRCSASR